MSSDGVKSILDDVLPDYKSVLKAPSLAQLEAIAREQNLDFEIVIRQERTRKYKAIDSSSGNVYLVQNPAVWESTGNGYLRPQPEFQFGIAEGRKFGGGARAKSKGSARESF